MAVDDETIRLARKLRIHIDSEVDATVRALVTAWARAWDEIHAAWADAMMDLADRLGRLTGRPKESGMVM